MVERAVDREVPRRMKTIGVIGGMGPQATMDFERRVHKVSQRVLPPADTAGYPPMHVFYYREAPMVLNADGSVPEVLEPDSRLLDVVRIVGASSDFLVMTANTPHFFHDTIEAAAGKPLLSIVDVTIDRLQQRNPRSVGVIATGDSLKHRLYQGRLDAINVPYKVIPEDLANRLDEDILALIEGRGEDVGRTAEEAVSYLRERDADYIILGCTEVPLLLGDAADEPDLINPIQLLAEAAINRAIAE